MAFERTPRNREEILDKRKEKLRTQALEEILNTIYSEARSSDPDKAASDAKAIFDAAWEEALHDYREVMHFVESSVPRYQPGSSVEAQAQRAGNEAVTNAIAARASAEHMLTDDGYITETTARQLVAVLAELEEIAKDRSRTS